MLSSAELWGIDPIQWDLHPIRRPEKIQIKGKTSKIMADQIMTVSKERLYDRIGKVTDEELAEIERVISLQLGTLGSTPDWAILAAASANQIGKPKASSPRCFLYARVAAPIQDHAVYLDAVAKYLQARPVGTTPIVAWHEVPLEFGHFEDGF